VGRRRRFRFARKVSPQVQRVLRRCALVAACTLLTINSSVRWLGGGDPHWFSPLHLSDKLSALGSLARHALAHGATCDPQAAAELVARAAERHGVPEQLALAVAHTESSLRAHAISRTGAMGLMQLMPGTAAWLEVGDAFDPQQNTDGGARYLAQLLRRYAGDRVRALAAYNLGPARVPARGALALPAETRAYVRRVLGARVRLASM
jgi:soluble lytic murein transglycosylase-like protein